MSHSSPFMQVAAVLVPIYRDLDGELRLVLVRRTDHGIHGGQIAFPGGKRIPEDNTLVDTAIREAREEIGIPAGAIEILEHLPVMETRTTGFRIYPFLARVVPPKEWRLEEQEVAEVLAVRIRDLSLPEVCGEELRHFPVRSDPGRIEPQRICFFRIGPHKLWGATYRILNPLIPRLVAGEWSV